MTAIACRASSAPSPAARRARRRRPRGLTLSELGRALGASKSSAFAILQTLLGYGFVADSGAGMSRRYRLGMALARLGDLVVSQIALRDVALPVLRDLTRDHGLDLARRRARRRRTPS